MIECTQNPQLDAKIYKEFPSSVLFSLEDRGHGYIFRSRPLMVAMGREPGGRFSRKQGPK